jgi:hypothetical protein
MKRSEFIKLLMSNLPDEDPELVWNGDGNGSVEVNELIYDGLTEKVGYYDFKSFLAIFPTFDVKTAKYYLVISSD